MHRKRPCHLLEPRRRRDKTARGERRSRRKAIANGVLLLLLVGGRRCSVATRPRDGSPRRRGAGRTRQGQPMTRRRDPWASAEPAHRLGEREAPPLDVGDREDGRRGGMPRGAPRGRPSPCAAVTLFSADCTTHPPARFPATLHHPSAPSAEPRPRGDLSLARDGVRDAGDRRSTPGGTHLMRRLHAREARGMFELSKPTQRRAAD